ncbi:MAG: nitrate reductase molybdenum cofactor assembly chaperone [Rothia sp. (in: high G+C Gram-positive bacteria)]|nr:nitrate reductase molybdenum cofactor assembly chaperone [Rothia sp. (in: high G+C Gram-positive bacteria)]
MAGFFSKLLGKGGAETEPARPASGDPFDIDWGAGNPEDAVIYQVSSVLFRYPSPEIQSMIPELLELARSINNPHFVQAVEAVDTWYTSAPMEQISAEYVQEYDLSRRHSFHLSYWTEGDTRRRGEALGRFKKMYRDSGMVTDLHGELPDYLPLVLEFTALIDPVAGRAAMQAYRPSLELLRLAMRDDHLAFHGLVECICATLPGESPETAQQVQELVGFGPPTEQVGLSNSDPRLLPLLQPQTGAQR